MSKAATNGNTSVITDKLKEHLDAHAVAIDDLHKKIQSIDGAVTSTNEKRVAELIDRAKQAHRWFSADAFACIPPEDGPHGQ